jgi:hypothetical protein
VIIEREDLSGRMDETVRMGIEGKAEDGFVTETVPGVYFVHFTGDNELASVINGISSRTGECDRDITKSGEMAKAKQGSCAREKFAKVMREASEGKLHSGGKSGKKVPPNSAQAKAIAYSEARRYCNGEKKNSRRHH